MIRLKHYMTLALIVIAQLIWAQVAEDLRLKRSDFKSLQGNNTVSVTSYEKDGNHYVYAGGYGDVDVFRLDNNGQLNSITQQGLYKEKGPARGMVADKVGDHDYLFVANKYGNAIEVFEILNDGSLDRVYMVEDTDETYIGTAITLQVVHMKKTSYLFAGGLEETPGLSCYQIHANGKLTHVQSMADNETIHTDGIIGMFVHKIKGKTYLYTGGFQDNGISSFRVYDNGKFKNINNIDDNTTDRYLTGAYPVNGLSFGDDHYVIVGHRHHKYYTRKGFIKNTDFVYHGDGVSVFKVDQHGALHPHYTLVDDESTQLQGQTRIEIVRSNADEAILAVGTRDDESIQLCRLDKNGTLSPLNYLETGYSIYYGLRAHHIDGQDYLLAGSNRFDMRKLVAYKVDTTKEDHSHQQLRHVVSFKFKDYLSKAEIAEAVDHFMSLKDKVAEVKSFEGGVNNSTEGLSKGFTHCFIITFANEHAREHYVFDEAHLAFGKKYGPMLADVLVMDYWVDE